jgi:hypothetical protein
LCKIREKLAKFAHDKLGWGYPTKGIEGFDGASFEAHCRFCGQKLLMDSNGDWFHV